MVKVFDETNKKEFYLDGILKDNLDLIKKKIAHDWDMVFIIGGIEGGGKSTLAQQLARYLSGARFTLNHICFSPEDFMEKITRDEFLRKGDTLILDEGFLINSRASMSKLNRTFLSILAECRQKNLFLVIVAPNFFDLDKNIALWRSRGLFYVYHESFERGFFRFYNYDLKKKLYILGKKLYNYSCVKPNFFGRFTKYLPINKEEYMNLKLKAFQNREHSKIEDKYLHQRDFLFKYMYEELKISQEDLSRIMSKCEYPLASRSIGDGIARVRDTRPYNKKLLDEDNFSDEQEDLK